MISMLLATYGAKLIGAGVVVIGVLFAYFKGSSNAKKKSQAEAKAQAADVAVAAAKNEVKVVKDQANVQASISGMSADDVRRKLHDQWQRD